MALLNGQMLAYVKREISYDSTKYTLFREMLPLMHSVANYQGDPSVLCFLCLCTIRFKEGSALPHFVPKKQFVPMTKQSKIPNITIKEYFERLIKQGDMDQYDWDDWEADKQTAEIIRAAGYLGQDKDQEKEVIQKIIGTEDGFKQRTPNQREIDMDTFGAEVKHKLKNCATSNTLYVAYVLNKDRQLIPVRNTILGLIHEYTGKKKSSLPQSYQQLEDMYVRGVATILLKPKNSKMPIRRGRKIDDTLPVFKSKNIKDDTNTDSLLFYSMQDTVVKFIIVNNRNLILGRIPAENFERSSLVDALKVLNNVDQNINKREEPKQQTPHRPKIGPQLEDPQANNNLSSNNTRTFDKQRAHTSQFESKINEAKPVPIPPKTRNQSTSDVNSATLNGDSKQQKNQPVQTPISPETSAETAFKEKISKFFKQQLEQLIKSKNAKYFNNPPAVDNYGQLLKDEQDNLVNPGGYTQTVKALNSENIENINFVLNKLNFVINRINRL